MRAAPKSRCWQLSSHHVPSLGSTKLETHHAHPPPTLSQTRPSRPRATRSLSGQMPQPGFPPSRARRKSRFRADERRLGSGRRYEPVRPRSVAMEARPPAPSSARRPAGTPPPPEEGAAAGSARSPPPAGPIPWRRGSGPPTRPTLCPRRGRATPQLGPVPPTPPPSPAGTRKRGSRPAAAQRAALPAAGSA